MTHLPQLQPFVDVNKRTSRLVANIPLIKANLFPLSFVDAPEEAYIDSTIAVYEFQRTEPLAELFVWAYERSTVSYKSLRTQVGQPDPLRARYREELILAVGSIVRGSLNSNGIFDWASQRVQETDVAKFVEIVAKEIANLHDGNFARFRIRLSEREKWRMRDDLSMV